MKIKIDVFNLEKGMMLLGKVKKVRILELEAWETREKLLDRNTEGIIRLRTSLPLKSFARYASRL